MTNPDEATVKEPSEDAWIAAAARLHDVEILDYPGGCTVKINDVWVPRHEAQAEQERMDREDEPTDEMVKAAVIYFHGERFLPNETMFKGMSNAIKAALKARKVVK